MFKKIIILSTVTLCICACNRNVPSNEGLEPAVTTRAYDRTETGALAGVDSELVEARVAVHTIDYKARRITVRNYHDMLETFEVSPSVKRFSEIKPGDKIIMSYARAMAFEVRKPTPQEIANPTIIGAGISKNPLNLPPGMEAAALKHTIVTVEAIDFKTNAVTVRTPEGKQVTTYAKNPDNLSRVKVGDTVAVTYGEAVVVDVKPLV